MSDERTLKVTDKRMFTADGELRDEYRSVGEAADAAAAALPAESSPEPVAAAPEPSPPPLEPAAPEGLGARPLDQGPTGDFGGPHLEIPGTPPGMGPAFFDLVAILAEPVAIYLGDVPLPDGQTAESLETARFYIDLLDVLRQKTAGNLTVQESGYLEDILYRLRLRYVQKRG